MKLWLLTGSAGYDELAGVVVRARSEKRAREIVAYHYSTLQKRWLDSKKTACQIITPSGSEEIIIEHWTSAS